MIGFFSGLSLITVILGLVLFSIPSRFYPSKLRAFLAAGKLMYWSIIGAVALRIFITQGLGAGSLVSAFFPIYWWGLIGLFSFLPIWLLTTFIVFYLRRIDLNTVWFYIVFFALLFISTAAYWFGIEAYCSQTMCNL